MKKLFLSTIICYSLIISCNTNSESENLLESEAKTSPIQNRSYRTEETPFIRKVAATFNKVAQQKEVWKRFKNLFQDNIAMKQNTKNSVLEDYFIMNASVTFEEHFMLNSSKIFKDDFVISGATLKDDVLPKATFREIFIKTYNALHPEASVEHHTNILNKLPKLYFGIPVSALNNYDTWKTNGFPITLKSYDANDNKLKKINKQETIEIIGLKNYRNLIEKSQQEQNSYYFTQNNEKTSVIAANKQKGGIITINGGNVNLATFAINNNAHFNSITITDSKETYTIPQNNMMHQTYIDDLPNGCNGFYVFMCGSQQMQQYQQQMQAIADKNCETIWRCIPCCEAGGGISYFTFLFKPQAIRCKNSQNYVNQLSMYSLLTPLD
ncbi:hypothetical protein OAT18_00850 [Tenacibaculum sp.]|nr:hypothetical protein [Tenacibaculum sp.]